MKQTARFRKLASIGVVLAMSVVGLSASAASASASKPSGTITFAEGAGAHPNYIFPVVACNYFSVANLNQFQQLCIDPCITSGSAHRWPYSLSCPRPHFPSRPRAIRPTR